MGSQAITTIEGLSADGTHPVQVAWQEIDVPQCGYCQAGQIMSAAALLAKTPQPDRQGYRRRDEPAISAAAAPICASARRFTRPPTGQQCVRQSTVQTAQEATKEIAMTTRH